MEKLSQNNSYKVVGLVGSIVTILACFVGAVTWVSINMANNTVSIQTLQKDHIRFETLISENSKIIGQHAQLLAILNQHSERIETLDAFMTQGGRFTEKDGKALHMELETVKERLQHYEVLETELSWIKRSIVRMETDMARRFDTITKKLDKRAN